MAEVLCPMDVFNTNKNKVNLIIQRLQRQLDFYVHIDELVSEFQERWIACFDDKYEDDDQFLRYMFVVMKNRMRDMKKSFYRYHRMHVSDPNKLTGLGDGEGDTGHVRVWNEMAVDTKEDRPEVNASIAEYIRMVVEELESNFHRKIFIKMVAGLPHKQIAEELGCSVTRIIKIKSEVIWPKVQEVMNIPDSKYEILIDSGRIYCK